MPIYSRDDKKIFFAAIPRAGSRSIKKLLEDNGWKENISDIMPFEMIPEIATDDLRTSHQHHNLWKRWRKEWEYEFAVVRNPYERYISQVYLVSDSKDINPTPSGMLLLAKCVFDSIEKGGFGIDDNHWRQQNHFLGPNTEFFRLEDQLDSLVKRLSGLGYVSKDSDTPHIGKSRDVNTIVAWPCAPDLHDKFLSLYSKDFSLFKYSTEIPTHGLKINWSKLKINTKILD